MPKKRNAWLKHVMALYERRQKVDPAYTFKQAMIDAKKTYVRNVSHDIVQETRQVAIDAYKAACTNTLAKWFDDPTYNKYAYMEKPTPKMHELARMLAARLTKVFKAKNVSKDIRKQVVLNCLRTHGISKVSGKHEGTMVKGNHLASLIWKYYKLHLANFS